MIVVTGGAGFIGSNIVRRLNAEGCTDVLVVDDLTDGRKMFNLADCSIADYLDREDFLRRIEADQDLAPHIDAVLHQGACSSTTEWNGRLLMQANFEFSKHVLDYCMRRRIALIYASSASVYGAGRRFQVDPACERPNSMYAYSKLVFDQYVRRMLPTAATPVVGLRYFNVYGPREAHKDAMASVVWHCHQQLKTGNEAHLFSGSGGFGDGEQRRDFIHVDDIVAVNLWFLGRHGRNGIYNLGTGVSRSFNDIGQALIRQHGRGSISYIPFPPHLEASYQHYTQADISTLRLAGYDAAFLPLETGIERYLKDLDFNS